MLKHYGPRILLSLAVLLVTLEVGLQVASRILPAVLARSGNESARVDDQTILCVGDSHTFGAPLPADEAYPAQLGDRLNGRGDVQDTRVVNLGIPGQNSAMVANRLEGQITVYEPDLIIVWVGLNNSWNFNEFDMASTNSRVVRWRQWLLKSKVIRLIVVSGFREVDSRPTLSESPRAKPTRKNGQQWSVGGELVEIPSIPDTADRLTLDAIRAQRVHDYARLIETAADYKVPMIFISYPVESLPNQKATNDAIRRVADDYGIPVVPSFQAFRRALRDGYKGSELIVEAVGPHPTQLLYRYVIDQLVTVVDRSLDQP